MLNDNLRPVWSAAARLEKLQWATDHTELALNEAMRRALLAGECLDEVAGAANMTEVEVISRAGLQLRDLADPAGTLGEPGERHEDQGPQRALEPA